MKCLELGAPYGDGVCRQPFFVIAARQAAPSLRDHHTSHPENSADRP